MNRIFSIENWRESSASDQTTPNLVSDGALALLGIFPEGNQATRARATLAYRRWIHRTSPSPECRRRGGGGFDFDWDLPMEALVSLPSLALFRFSSRPAL